MSEIAEGKMQPVSHKYFVLKGTMMMLLFTLARVKVGQAVLSVYQLQLQSEIFHIARIFMSPRGGDCGMHHSNADISSWDWKYLYSYCIKQQNKKMAPDAQSLSRIIPGHVGDPLHFLYCYQQQFYAFIEITMSGWIGHEKLGVCGSEQIILAKLSARLLWNLPQIPKVLLG